MKSYTFNNISVTVKAESASKAYDLLSDTLDCFGSCSAYSTDTYTQEGDETERDTSDLFTAEEERDNENKPHCIHNVQPCSLCGA